MICIILHLLLEWRNKQENFLQRFVVKAIISLCLIRESVKYSWRILSVNGGDPPQIRQSSFANKNVHKGEGGLANCPAVFLSFFTLDL